MCSESSLKSSAWISIARGVQDSKECVQLRFGCGRVQIWLREQPGAAGLMRAFSAAEFTLLELFAFRQCHRNKKGWLSMHGVLGMNSEVPKQGNHSWMVSAVGISSGRVCKPQLFSMCSNAPNAARKLSGRFASSLMTMGVFLEDVHLLFDVLDVEGLVPIDTCPDDLFRSDCGLQGKLSWHDGCLCTWAVTWG